MPIRGNPQTILQANNGPLLENLQIRLLCRPQLTSLFNSLQILHGGLITSAREPIQDQDRRIFQGTLQLPDMGRIQAGIHRQLLLGQVFANPGAPEVPCQHIRSPISEHLAAYEPRSVLTLIEQLKQKQAAGQRSR